jgi:hypothetical protein
MSHFSILNSTYFSTVGVGKPEGLKMVIIFYLVFYIYNVKLIQTNLGL